MTKDKKAFTNPALLQVGNRDIIFLVGDVLSFGVSFLHKLL